mgnify:CR=1 FL=1
MVTRNGFERLLFAVTSLRFGDRPRHEHPQCPALRGDLDRQMAVVLDISHEHQRLVTVNATTELDFANELPPTPHASAKPSI